MAKPRLGWYTADQLAKEWAKYGIRKEEIDNYLEIGILKRWKRFASSTTDKDVFLEAPPFSWTEEDEDSRLLNGRRDLYVVLDITERPDYIMLEEVERFEKEHDLVVDGNVVRPEEEQQVDPVTSNEPPIKGFKGIAGFFNVTERTAKTYAKKKGFPIHKTTTGQVYAFASELKDWGNRRSEK